MSNQQSRIVAVAIFLASVIPLVFDLCTKIPIDTLSWVIFSLLIIVSTMTLVVTTVLIERKK